MTRWWQLLIAVIVFLPIAIWGRLLKAGTTFLVLLWIGKLIFGWEMSK